jgi:histone H3/H4
MEEKEEKTIRRKKNHYYEIYISKVIKQISENCGITSDAKQQLNSFLCILSKHISLVVTRLTIIGKKKTISEKEILNALSIILNGELLKNSLIEGERAIKNFKNDDKKGSRQNKAGIIFPPSITEKFLRNFGNSKLMITSSAPIYMAAALEYLTYEILDLSCMYTKDNKRIRITIRDLEIVTKNDVEINKLFTKLNISFLGGGVIPFIHNFLLKKKKKKKTLNANNKHRFRPGTVAIRNIKKYQKESDTLILAKSSFEKIVRNTFKEIKMENVKISKDVFIILQHFIEQYIVKLFYNANFLAIHSGRVKLISTDIAFISYLFNDSKNPYNNVINDNLILTTNEIQEDNILEEYTISNSNSSNNLSSEIADQDSNDSE